MTELPVNQVILGECSAVMSTWPAGSVDLIVTSPPYDDLDENLDSQGGMRTYDGYDFDFKKIADQCWRVLKDGGVLCWIVQNGVRGNGESCTVERQNLYFTGLGFKKHVIIYAKDGRYTRLDWYRRSFEFINCFIKDTQNDVAKIVHFNMLKDHRNVSFFVHKWRRNHASNRGEDGEISVRKDYNVNPFGPRDDIWFYHNGYMKTTKDKIAYEQGAIMPDLMAEDLINSFSNEGDVVLDPMAGSGTVLKAAAKLNRKYIGIEISQKSIEQIINKRLELHRPDKQERLIL